MSHWKYTDTEYREDVGYIGILERDDKCVLLDATNLEAITYVGEYMKRGDTYAEHDIHGVNKEGIISYESVRVGRVIKQFPAGQTELVDYLREVIYG